MKSIKTSKNLNKSRLFVFSLYHVNVVNTPVNGLQPYLEKGDIIIIDIGNENVGAAPDTFASISDAFRR